MNCHNGEKYIKEAINSLINQSYKNWELIFFDNASNDNSAVIAKKYDDKRIKYHYSKFVNLGIARKKALEKCRGDFIAFLDCDDFWTKNKLKLQVNELIKNPKIVLSFSNSYFFNKKKKKLLYENKPYDGYIFEELLKRYYISFDTVLINAFYLNKLKQKFDERLTITHDLDLIIRLSKIGNFKYLDKPLSWWRIHNNSYSQNKMNIVNKEKNIFLTKLKQILIKHKDKKRLINYFKDNLTNSRIEQCVIDKKLIKFFKLVFDLNKINYKNLILLFFIIVPFGNYIYKKLKKSW
ncbi:glycosyltransferase [Candidatus Pelagibacter sp.]|nr:glycosyltransferase [Candidatus Pelagibacter sp.]